MAGSHELNITNNTDIDEHDISYEIFQNIPSFMYRELTIAYNLTGVLFNIILITYFIKSRKYRSPTFMLLTSLAFMDLLCCMAGASWSAFLFPIVPLPEVGVGCQLFVFLGDIGLFGSEYHLVFFASLRFYQLAFPLSAKANITSKFVLKGCLIITFVFIMYSLHLAFLYGLKPFILDGKPVVICTYGGNRYVYDITLLTFNTIIPCLAIPLLHVAKYVAVWKNRVAVVSEQQSRQNADARAVTIVIIMFFVAWFPAYTYVTIQHRMIENYRKMRDKLYLTLMYFVFSNSTLNPVIYCFACKTVRDDIVKFFCPGKQKKSKN